MKHYGNAEETEEDGSGKALDTGIVDGEDQGAGE